VVIFPLVRILDQRVFIEEFMQQDAVQHIISDYGLSDDLLNDLLIVIGECDLLGEELPEYHFSKRIRVIREIAVRMSKRVVERQILRSQNAH
jgi:hypothetical protein